MYYSRSSVPGKAGWRRDWAAVAHRGSSQRGVLGWGLGERSSDCCLQRESSLWALRGWERKARRGSVA